MRKNKTEKEIILLSQGYIDDCYYACYYERKSYSLQILIQLTILKQLLLSGNNITYYFQSDKYFKFYINKIENNKIRIYASLFSDNKKIRTIIISEKSDNINENLFIKILKFLERDENFYNHLNPKIKKIYSKIKYIISDYLFDNLSYQIIYKNL